MRLPDDPALKDELARVRLKETGPNLLKVEHRSGEHNDRVISLGIAATHLLSQSAGSGRARVVKMKWVDDVHYSREEQAAMMSGRGETMFQRQRRQAVASGLVGHTR